MAEFEYIMRKANRMCDTQTICNKECPVYMHGNCCVSTRGRGIGGEIDYTSVAKAVIDWAKDHPEPMYPSWRDAWEQLFPGVITGVCPLMCVTGGLRDKYYTDCKSGLTCDKCKKTPIPAEIAKNLGIKPIITK